MLELKKKVTYISKKGSFYKWKTKLDMWSIRLRSKDYLTAHVWVKTGDTIMGPVKDLLYKDKKGCFWLYKFNKMLDDEIPDEMIFPDEYGNAGIGMVYHNATGNVTFIKPDPEKIEYQTKDIRLNDVFESIAMRVMELFRTDKERKAFYVFMMMSYIGLGLFIMFGLFGLGQVVNEGIASMTIKATNAMAQAAQIPLAP